METTVDSERAVQNKVIDLLHNVHGYRYIGNLKEQENYNVRHGDLMKFLVNGSQHCTLKQAEEAYRKLTDDTVCADYAHLYEVNKAVYHDLRYPTQAHEENADFSRQVYYIDWQHPERNDFAIAEEVTVRRDIEDAGHRRPDLVVYVNGIALCVLELKKDSVSVADAIRQNIRNQEDGEILQFFTTVQLIMAGNGSEGLHYGVIKTPEKYWLKWKEPTGSPCDPSPYTAKDYPDGIDTACKKALYDNLGKDESAVKAVYNTAKANAEIGWREMNRRKLKLRKAVKKVLPEGFDLETIMNILVNHDEI
jgi:type I restriction enzyme R subunit